MVSNYLKANFPVYSALISAKIGIRMGWLRYVIKTGLPQATFKQLGRKYDCSAMNLGYDFRVRQNFRVWRCAGMEYANRITPFTWDL